MGNKLAFKLNFRSSNPIYIQIINQIKHMIASGLLKPEDQLPTVRQLAADLRVNFNTIARAYRVLDDEGFISTQHGRGTFILPPPEDAARLRREDLARLTRHYLNDVFDLGFLPEEVLDVLEEKINYWQETGKPPEIQDL